MLVSELIKELQQYDDKMEVYYSDSEMGHILITLVKKNYDCTNKEYYNTTEPFIELVSLNLP